MNILIGSHFPGSVNFRIVPLVKNANLIIFYEMREKRERKGREKKEMKITQVSRKKSVVLFFFSFIRHVRFIKR